MMIESSSTLGVEKLFWGTCVEAIITVKSYQPVRVVGIHPPGISIKYY